MRRLKNMCLVLSFVILFFGSHSILTKRAEAFFGGLGGIVLDPSNLAQNALSAKTLIRQISQGLQLVNMTKNLDVNIGGILGLTDKTGKMFGLDLGLGEIRRMANISSDVQYGFKSAEKMMERGDYAGVLDDSYWLMSDLGALSRSTDRFSKNIGLSTDTFGIAASSSDASKYATIRVNSFDNLAHISRATALEHRVYAEDSLETVATLRSEASNALESANGEDVNGSIKQQLHSINLALIANYEKQVQIQDLLSRQLELTSQESLAESAYLAQQMDTGRTATLFNDIVTEK